MLFSIYIAFNREKNKPTYTPEAKVNKLHVYMTTTESQNKPTYTPWTQDNQNIS